MYKFISVLLLTIVMNNLKAQAESTISTQFQWMIGTWEISIGEEKIVEVWTSPHPDTLKGYSCLKYGDNTDTLELISITMKNGIIAYGAKVIGENGGEIVYFPFVGYQDGWFVFQNLTHDYPTHIAYMRTNENTLDAYISGNGNSEPARFRYTKSDS